MACTVVHTKQLSYVNENVIELKLSSLTSGLDETLDHGGPHGVKPAKVTCEQIIPCTDGSILSFVHKEASDDLTNDHIVVNFACPPGGSLDGAVVLLHVTFRAAASGGMDPV